MTFADIIRQFGTDDDMASALAAVGVNKINGEMVKKWRQRNSIPSPYWHAVIRASGRQVTAEQMVKIAAAVRP